jgi:hypothetical protein
MAFIWFEGRRRRSTHHKEATNKNPEKTNCAKLSRPVTLVWLVYTRSSARIVSISCSDNVTGIQHGTTQITEKIQFIFIFPM